jgi:hypothetical protein
MLIVIEGLDRTGKSTLAETVRDRLGPMTRLIHHGPPEHDDPIVEYLDELRTYRPGNGADIVIDRHYLGETVWPKAFDRPSTMTDLHREVIETYLRDKAALLVLATRPIDEIIPAITTEVHAPRYDVEWADRAFRLSFDQAKLAKTEYEQDAKSVDLVIQLARTVEEGTR